MLSTFDAITHGPMSRLITAGWQSARNAPYRRIALDPGYANATHKTGNTGP